MDTVTIPMEEYEDLLDSAKMLSALHFAGVDNWEGYDFAMDAYQEEE